MTNPPFLYSSATFVYNVAGLKQVDPQGVSLLPLPRYAPSPPPTNNRRSFQSLSPLLPAQSNSQYNRARQYCETDASDEKIQRTRLQYDKIRWDWEAFRSGEHGTYLVQSVAALLARLIWKNRQRGGRQNEELQNCKLRSMKGFYEYEADPYSKGFPSPLCCCIGGDIFGGSYC